jgi:hypothetical protein
VCENVRSECVRVGCVSVRVWCECESMCESVSGVCECESVRVGCECV